MRPQLTRAFRCKQEHAGRGASRTPQTPMIVSMEMSGAIQIEIHLGGKRMARKLSRLVLLTLLAALAFPALLRPRRLRRSSASASARAIFRAWKASAAMAPGPDPHQYHESSRQRDGRGEVSGGILDREGIHSEIFETTPGRGFLVARLSASAVPDPSRALLLMGHLDVVGVDKTKWTVDPFGAVIQGNYLYGRGAIDDKGMLIPSSRRWCELKRSNARLNRDVIFLAEAGRRGRRNVGNEDRGGKILGQDRRGIRAERRRAR